MAERLRHRGPDDGGDWVDASHGIALGFRRLAIQDISVLGHQPMISASGRYVIAFNGEIYNFRDLRSHLMRHGFAFKGGSDTEVVLAGFEAWGIRASLDRFIGMFAMAIWDSVEQVLFLVRDRLGVKPLYVGHLPGGLAFGSELRSLLALPEILREIDVNAAALFLRHLYVPAPRSIIKGVWKLSPGHLLQYRPTDDVLSEPEPWWTPASVAKKGLNSPFEGTVADAVAQLDLLIEDSVSRRMISDVPLGAFLSAGIDSSTVVAKMQAVQTMPVRTFSVAFDDEDHDESAAAAAIAAHLGTDHTELRLTGKDALDLAPRIVDVFDEPHADTSQIPLYLLCASAREHVTVVLSGDGGDEVFGGYNRYGYGERIINRLGSIPLVLRRSLAAALEVASPRAWDRVFNLFDRLLPQSAKHRLAGEKMLKLARTMRGIDQDGMYEAVVSAWQHPTELVGSGSMPRSAFGNALRTSAIRDLFHRMLLADQVSYLPGDQLAKVDRVSMAVGLEMRVPLLDHRVVEFAWTLPKRYKSMDGTGKWILRQVLAQYLPDHFVERPKMGLSVPLAEWLRGPLRPWAEELLSQESLRSYANLNPAPVRLAWERLLAGRSELALQIWAVLMLQGWARRWVLKP